MSAYIFYGAVDTLKYADALENVINGRTVPVVMSGTVLLLAIFAVAILTKVLPVMEKRFSKTVVVLGADSDSTGAADIVPAGSFENI